MSNSEPPLTPAQPAPRLGVLGSIRMARPSVAHKLLAGSMFLAMASVSFTMWLVGAATPALEEAGLQMSLLPNVTLTDVVALSLGAACVPYFAGADRPGSMPDSVLKALACLLLLGLATAFGNPTVLSHVGWMAGVPIAWTVVRSASKLSRADVEKCRESNGHGLLPRPGAPFRRTGKPD